ncbi:sce7725 family protein [Alteromonas sp. B31-7]|nr:sce7725 family protein [Alteromonas sp. B31-7]QPL51898.1 sce7725 family protein [Alteromonas sp. B31-7]
MYFPYFRGKQNELITIRNNASLMAQAGFVPIIEPVKETLNGLKRALDSVVNSKGRAIVIVNPFHGDYSKNGDSLTNLLAEHFDGEDGISAGILLTNEISLEAAISSCKAHEQHSLTLIHAGFAYARELSNALGDKVKDITHCFFEEDAGKLYQKHFMAAKSKILIRDGFKKRKNREHPSEEFFSDLHATFQMENMQGFGDFLIVGDEYSESGGPAYAVAIHLTFIDEEQDEAMFIYHFISDRQDTPQDPAGKFLEALNKLIIKADEPTTKILATKALAEFRDLHERKHFPGLGYVKKLSMQHHIEVLADFFNGK